MGIKTLKVIVGDFSFVNGGFEVIEGVDALAQIINNRLSLWLGEWFVVPFAGVDYLGLFNQKTFLEDRARIVFKNAILADPRITKLTKFDITFDQSIRTFSIDFVAESTEGLITGGI